MYLPDLIFNIYLYEYKYLSLVLPKAVVFAMYKVQQSHFLNFCADVLANDSSLLKLLLYVCGNKCNKPNFCYIFKSIRSNVMAFWNNDYSLDFYSLADLKYSGVNL